MIEIRIWLPPINLWSKPWQHEFDKGRLMKKRDHTLLKAYWERRGKPPLYFKHGDDPWLPTDNPSFNPAFQYGFVNTVDVMQFASSESDSQETTGESYEYKRGYKQALDDIKAETERLSLARRSQLKNNM